MAQAALIDGVTEGPILHRSLFVGCTDDCRLCLYRDNAMQMARIERAAEWKVIRINDAVIEEQVVERGRTVVLNCHNITTKDQRHLLYRVIGRWLKAGCRVVIDTRGAFDVLTRVVREFNDQVSYRIEIGSNDPETLKYWEPRCPSLHERMTALQYLNIVPTRRVSVLIRYYDATTFDLIPRVEQYVTGSITLDRWCDALSGFGAGISDARLSVLRDAMSDISARILYAQFSDTPAIRWGATIRRLTEAPS